MTALLADAPVAGRATPIATGFARLRVALFYRWRHGQWPELDRPRRFTEWVQWRKLNDRSHARALLTDKLHGKAIALGRLGAAAVVPTLWSGDRLPPAAPWPMPFVVKSNHGCRQVRVVRSAADYAAARRAARSWLARPYGEILDEWHYRAARPTLLVEPFVANPGERLPIDYKIYVFGGRAELVQVHHGRGGAHHRWAQYDRDWRAMSDVPLAAERPAQLAAMLDAAEAMAAGEEFLRVDFYCVAGRVLFGEYCLFPGSGLDRFSPVSLDDWLGAKWAAARRAA